jgi:hypothetical protein
LFKIQVDLIFKRNINGISSATSTLGNNRFEFLILSVGGLREVPLFKIA